MAEVISVDKQRKVSAEQSAIMILNNELKQMELSASQAYGKALSSKGINNDPVQGYLDLLTNEQLNQKESPNKNFAVKFIDDCRKSFNEKGIRGTTKHALEDGKKTIENVVWGTLAGKLVTAGLTLGTLGETALKGDFSAQAVTLNFLNNCVRWAGVGITEINGWSLLAAAGGASVYFAIPAYIQHAIETRGKKTEVELTRQRIKSEKRSDALSALKEGRADLRPLTGADVVGIFVGKADPTVEPLSVMLKDIGVDVVTYWDEENSISDKFPFWIKTRNDWTSKKNLTLGAIEKTKAIFAEVSNQYDLWLSSRERDPEQPIEDMSDTEIFDTTEVIEQMLNKDSVPPIISVTNPKRAGMGVVAGEGKNPYGTATVENVKDQYPEVSLLDPDIYITASIAAKAEGTNLPLELYTDASREKEYNKLLRETVIPEHNKRVENGMLKAPILKYKDQTDKLNTLTVIYGNTDGTTDELLRDYLANTKRITKEFEGKEPVGDYLVILNYQKEIDRLPPEARDQKKYICIGEIMAQKQFDKFVELVKSGTIKLSDEALQRMRRKGLLY